MTPEYLAEEVLNHFKGHESSTTVVAYGNLLKEQIVRVINAALREEREACATVADRETNTADKLMPMTGQHKAKCIAAAIRARSTADPGTADQTAPSAGKRP